MLCNYVIACDAYENAPAMQVSDVSEVFNMLDRDKLKSIIDRYKPNFIVPEVEAIQTEVLIEVEKDGYTVIPSAKAVNLTMNRDKIRDRAKSLGLKTANYAYAETEEALILEAKKIGSKVAIKPVMSSSGKGQSYASSEDEVKKAWKFAIDGMRGNRQRVIVEEFISFDYEITLLTLTQNYNNTLFCPPIGHRQERGDYQESWQPMKMEDTHLKTAQEMAARVTDALGGNGIWGVEFFIGKKGVYFSELSPRPHDTGMVTLGGTQNYSEFELHARAILGIPIIEIPLIRNGASAVVLADNESSEFPIISGLEEASNYKNTDFKIFGKPSTRKYRRMAVALAFGQEETSILIDRAKKVASKIKID